MSSETWGLCREVIFFCLGRYLDFSRTAVMEFMVTLVLKELSCLTVTMEVFLLEDSSQCLIVFLGCVHPVSGVNYNNENRLYFIYFLRI